jgi:hypothetical protein
VTDSAILPEVSPVTQPRRDTWVLSVAVGLVSFASLLLELALTRLFSVVLFYHFAFLAISVALLGLGAGGVFAHVRRARLANVATARLAVLLCTLNALLIVAVLEVVLHLPVSLDLTWRNFGKLSVMYCAAAAPFFCTGLLFAVVFARAGDRVGSLYGADLVGGAAACLAIVPLLNWIGGPNAVVAAALAMAIAGILWTTMAESISRRKPRPKPNPGLDGAPRDQMGRRDRARHPPRRQPLRKADRHRLRQGDATRPAVDGVRALECHLARRGQPGRRRQVHRD